MKKTFLGALVTIFILGIFSVSFAGEKPRMGVLRFTNHTNAGWWNNSTGSELQDMLASELRSTRAFQVLERKEINAVIGEQDLGESGRVDPATRARIGKIKGAQFLVAGTVTSYEENTSGTGGGFGVAGFSIGGEKKTAYIAVDLKVIDTTTGEIVDSRSIEASSSSGGLSFGASHGIFSGGLSRYAKTPAGKAIRACVIEITDYLKCSMIEGKDSSCMQDYDAKENKRRDNTKKSIDLE